MCPIGLIVEYSRMKVPSLSRGCEIAQFFVRYMVAIPCATWHVGNAWSMLGSMLSSRRQLVPFFRQSPFRTFRQTFQCGFVVDTFVEMFEMEIVEKKGTSCRRLMLSSLMDLPNPAWVLSLGKSRKCCFPHALFTRLAHTLFSHDWRTRSFHTTGAHALSHDWRTRSFTRLVHTLFHTTGAHAFTRLVHTLFHTTTSSCYHIIM